MQRLKVSDPERSAHIVWREIMRSQESRYDHRLHGILFVCRGMSCYETAAIWGSSPRAVEYWVRRFEDNGLEGLWEKPRSGRPPNLGRMQVSRLERELRRPPREFGYPRRRWTGELVRRHLSEIYRVDLGVRQCQRMLRNVAERCEI